MIDKILLVDDNPGYFFELMRKVEPNLNIQKISKYFDFVFDLKSAKEKINSKN